MDLDLVPTPELIRALEARYDYVVFAGAQDRGKVEEHRQQWKGHVVFCQGMCLDLIREMQDYAREEDDDEDEIEGRNI